MPLQNEAADLARMGEKRQDRALALCQCLSDFAQPAVLSEIRNGVEAGQAVEIAGREFHGGIAGRAAGLPRHFLLLATIFVRGTEAEQRAARNDP